MSPSVKTDMKKKAKITEGILNLLKDDIYQLRADANDFDLICLEESIRDTKNTIQMLSDNVKEIEYMLYLINSRT